MGKGTGFGAVLLCISLVGCSEGVHHNTSQPPIEKSSKIELKVVEIQPEEPTLLHPIKVEKGVKLDPIIEKDIMKKKAEQSTPIAGLFKTSLEPLLGNGKVTLNFSIQNVSGKDLEISHSSGQKYDIFVYNEQQDEVYKWSNNKAFTEALIVRSLKKDEKLAFAEEWNLKDASGESVPPGTYKIQIKGMITLKSGVISPDELTDTATIEIKK
ncbi:hypothetical protein GC093_28495 [Paenibacillus sp. LMG 31456]|uniref:Intracellular proteinase inhibitor BsuPI domain-containing protein n=1 Tax=Paenibacillus foliorum TaxID=2654974 RepID=A0A972K3M9_9BACL|nr:BsuPI-related putative proteinase inhibitor [Paenibacillus foliorum]NOU97135.1 hypothetical protein [Paenibacillus foliorum]